MLISGWDGSPSFFWFPTVPCFFWYLTIPQASVVHKNMIKNMSQNCSCGKRVMCPNTNRLLPILSPFDRHFAQGVLSMRIRIQHRLQNLDQHVGWRTMCALLQVLDTVLTFIYSSQISCDYREDDCSTMNFLWMGHELKGCLIWYSF